LVVDEGVGHRWQYVDGGFHLELNSVWRGENLADQQRATALVASLPDRGDPERGENRRYGLPYVDVIERFGRFPHRNAILGRVSTPEEVEFLKQPGSSF